MDNDLLTLPNLNKVIEEHSDMVKKIANYLNGRVYNHFCKDDLIQAGMIGLMKAHKDYREDHGTTFKTYAYIRIRGHILDEIRALNWFSRNSYKNFKMVYEQDCSNDVVSVDFLEKNVADIADLDEKKEIIWNCVKNLPLHQRIVLYFFYQKEYTLKDIGIVLNLTEGRICQIRKEALVNLRSLEYKL